MASVSEPMSQAILTPPGPPSPAISFVPNNIALPASEHLHICNHANSTSDPHDNIVISLRPFMRESPSRRGLHSCFFPSVSRTLACIIRGRLRLLDSRLWITIRFLVTLSQIMAVMLVLAMSREKKAGNPLPAWLMGYALGCMATLPLFYRRLKANGDRISHSQGFDNRTLDRSHTQETNDSNRECWIEIFMDRLRIFLEFFFAIWFVLGNVWVFGRPSVAQTSPKLYSLCVALLVLSCLRYLMPLVFCFALCCCSVRPAIRSSTSDILIDQLGEREGATQELINATLAI